MFEFIRTHRRWVMFILLVLIIPPFAFFGIERYFQEPEQAIAKVAGGTVTRQDFEQVQRERLDRARQQLGPDFDARIFETPQARAAILDSILLDRALVAEAARANVQVSDEHLRQVIAGIPAFQTNGKFDPEVYKTLLTAQGMTGQVFDARLRADLKKQLLLAGIAESAIVPKAVQAALTRALEEQREVRILVLRPEDFLAQVKVSDDQVRKFYDANQKRFETPESMKVEYVVLTPEAVTGDIVVPEAELRTYYEQNKARYGEPEQRRASHILIASEGIGRDAARKQAEDLLGRLKANPAEFDKLAREFSKDSGSADKGGDLGWFGRNMMVKPFEDAAFALKDGETSGVVDSEFGSHIIRLTGIKAGTPRSFEQLRPDLEKQFRAQQAGKKFSEAAEQFTNLVYEQPDSLGPAAERLKLKVQTADGIGRQAPPPQPGAPQLLSQKVVDALFSEDALRNKRNTQAIEVAPSTLVAARVLEHRPAAVRPFDSAKAEIRQVVEREEAAKLATAAGQKKLADLTATPSDTGFSAAAVVSRLQPQGLPPAIVNDIMRVPADKVPGYIGSDLPGAGFLITHVVNVKPVDQGDTAQRDARARQVAQQLGAADDLIYAEALKKRHKAIVLKPEFKADAAPAR